MKHATIAALALVAGAAIAVYGWWWRQLERGLPGAPVIPLRPDSSA